MKHLAVTLLAALFIGGCATAAAPESNVTYTPRQPTPSTPASALAFDPPVTAYNPPLNLDRSIRQPAAFVGFDSLQQTVTVTRQEDRQFYFPVFSGRSQFFGSALLRRSTVETVAVRSR